MYRREGRRADKHAMLRERWNISMQDHGLGNLPWVVAQTEIASYDMLEQTHGLAFDQSEHHVAQNRTDRVEAFVRLTNVREPEIIEENLLNDEDCYRF